MTCICGETQMKQKTYSTNFNQSICLKCRSICFEAKEGVNWFDYDSKNDKYSDENYLSHGEFRWAHIKIFNLLKKQRGAFLELGTFNGFFANHLAAKLDIDIYGEDMNAEAIEIGKKIYPNISNRLGLVEEFKKVQFDGIILIDVFEHIENPKLFVEIIRKRLKTGGKVYLSGPTIERLFHDRSDMPPHHPWRYSSLGMINFFKNNGFKLVEHKIERNGPLLIRNLIGLFLARFPKEFNGESVNFKPKSGNGWVYTLLNYFGVLVSFLLYIFRIQYCSQLMVYEKV